MKIKILLFAMITFSVLAFIFSNPKSIQKNINLSPNRTSTWTWNGDIQFLIGSHQSGLEPDLSRIKNELGFNFWMRYIGSRWNPDHKYWYTNGWTDDDSLLFSGRPPQVESIIDNNYYDTLKTIMHRPKLNGLLLVHKVTTSAKIAVF